MNKEQQALDAWFKEKSWPYWTPHEILARLMEETGEFARLINHQYGPKKKKEGEEVQDFEDELGDILYTLACFANTHDINLDAALERSLDKVQNRDKDRF
jgi:NTP pyrophosphatase (non-canonical NTP hydrolase)